VTDTLALLTKNIERYYRVLRHSELCVYEGKISKIVGIWFPIMAFVLAGFEHSIANMYYLCAGVFASNNANWVAKAGELYNIGAEQIAKLNFAGFCANLIPVTIGNVIGGVGLGFLLWLCFKSKAFNKPAA